MCTLLNKLKYFNTSIYIWDPNLSSSSNIKNTSIKTCNFGQNLTKSRNPFNCIVRHYIALFRSNRKYSHRLSECYQLQPCDRRDSNPIGKEKIHHRDDSLSTCRAPSGQEIAIRKLIFPLPANLKRRRPLCYNRLIK